MIISAIIWLLGKLSEKTLDQILDHFNAKKEAKQKVEGEFMRIYTSLRFTHLVPQLDQHLKRLRDFFQGEYKLLEKPEIAQFYTKWIEARWIPIEFNADDRFWTQARHAELLEDMEKIKLVI
jgi:hypothetical protein